MNRTSVITGAASGIGLATKELLESRGERVIGVDLRNADVTVDLTLSDDRNRMVAEVTELSGVPSTRSWRSRESLRPFRRPPR